MRLDGDADSGFNGSNGYVDVSYGREFAGLNISTYPDAYYVDRGGRTYSRYYTSGSYGESPATNFDDHAWYVGPGGNVYDYDYSFVYSNSYGRNLLI